MPSQRLFSERRQVSAPVSMDPEDAQRCCICFDAYCTSTRDDGAEVPIQLPCGHVFGGTCITRWMQTKTTCPLCRFGLFDVEFDHNNEYGLWIGEHEHDSAIQPSGAFSGHTSTYSFAFEFPGERITMSELSYSAARSSTAAHRSFDARSGSTLSATPQYATQPCHSHAQMGRRYGHRKTSTSHLESEDVWITALGHKRDDVAAVGVDDSWTTAPGDDMDKADEPELHWQLYLREATVLSLPDSLFDDLVAGHMQWMAELNQALYDSYDVFDFLV
jgi:hypothetical protein